MRTAPRTNGRDGGETPIGAGAIGHDEDASRGGASRHNDDASRGIALGHTTKPSRGGAFEHDDDASRGDALGHDDDASRGGCSRAHDDDASRGRRCREKTIGRRVTAIDAAIENEEKGKVQKRRLVDA